MQVPQNRLACHSHLSPLLSQDLYRNPQWLPSTMPPQHVSHRRECLELPLCQSYPSHHALTEQVSQSWRFYVIVSMASLNALSDTFDGVTMKQSTAGAISLIVGAPILYWLIANKPSRRGGEDGYPDWFQGLLLAILILGLIHNFVRWLRKRQK